MSEQISDRAGLSGLVERLKQFVPAKFRRGAAVVPVVRLSVISVMPLPRKLTNFYHAAVIESNGTAFALQSLSGCDGAAEKYMKIYLLILLIGALLTAIHFTSAPERSKTLPQ